MDPYMILVELGDLELEAEALGITAPTHARIFRRTNSTSDIPNPWIDVFATILESGSLRIDPDKDTVEYGAFQGLRLMAGFPYRRSPEEDRSTLAEAVRRISDTVGLSDGTTSVSGAKFHALLAVTLAAVDLRNDGMTVAREARRLVGGPPIAGPRPLQPFALWILRCAIPIAIGSAIGAALFVIGLRLLTWLGLPPGYIGSEMLSVLRLAAVMGSVVVAFNALNDWVLSGGLHPPKPRWYSGLPGGLLLYAVHHVVAETSSAFSFAVVGPASFGDALRMTSHIMSWTEISGWFSLGGGLMVIFLLTWVFDPRYPRYVRMTWRMFVPGLPVDPGFKAFVVEPTMSAARTGNNVDPPN